MGPSPYDVEWVPQGQSFILHLDLPARLTRTKTGLVAGYFYIFGLMFAKVSLLMLLYRIFSVDTKFRIASWVIGFVVVVWTLLTLLLETFSCHPLRAIWDLKVYMDPSTHCDPKWYNVLNIHGYCNVITDFSLLFLPNPMVWKLQMGVKKRLSIAAVFASGSLCVTLRMWRLSLANGINSICAISIVRLYMSYHSDRANDNWAGTRIKVWSKSSSPVDICLLTLPWQCPSSVGFRL